MNYKQLTNIMVLSILALILTSTLSSTLAQTPTSSISGTFDDSSPCFLYLPGFSYSYHPYNRVLFTVPTTRTYTFRFASTSIPNVVWFYLYEGIHNEHQNYNQPSFLGIASSGGYNGAQITATLTAGRTYIMATNNDENFSTRGDCESRPGTLTGNYVLNVSNLIILLDGLVIPPDDRINWQHGDLYAVLYHGLNNIGEPAINVFCWDGETAIADIQLSESNMSNGLHATACNLTFYILAQGTYQFNIYYDGKIYEIECQTFECPSPQMRYFDPGE